jgi:TPR repeat protein
MSPEEAEEITLRAIDLHEAGRFDEAVAMYMPAAKAGHVVAQGNMATLLDDYVCPRRPGEAVFWYKRAHRNGSVTAAWNLAIHYKMVGKRRWYNYWLKVAADGGDEDAQAELESLRL